MVTFGYFYRCFIFGKSFRNIIGYIAVGSLLHENILFQGEIRPRTELIPFRKFIIRSWWTVAVHRNPLDFFFFLSAPVFRANSGLHRAQFILRFSTSLQKKGRDKIASSGRHYPLLLYSSPSPFAAFFNRHYSKEGRASGSLILQSLHHPRRQFFSTFLRSLVTD